jgi:hypothetical protein
MRTEHSFHIGLATQPDAAGIGARKTMATTATAPDAYLQSGSSPPELTPSVNREVLAQRIIRAVDSLATKLADLEADIRALWTEFENLPKGETILGCSTKKEFCEKQLHRTPRALRYMLKGDSNPDYVPVAQREEIISPAAPTGEPDWNPKQVHVAGGENAPLFWKALGNKLNALLPAYSDGSEHVTVALLEQAYNEPLSDDPTVLQSIVVMLKKISADYAKHAQKLEERIKGASC